MNSKIEFPLKLLRPIRNFLEEEIKRLQRTRKGIKAGDPFNDETRTSSNSLEEDVDEQIGHFDTQVKANFLKGQIVQFKRALARLKGGKYGICESCGQMIDTDRLAATPETTICIKCERERES